MKEGPDFTPQTEEMKEAVTKELKTHNFEGLQGMLPEINEAKTTSGN